MLKDLIVKNRSYRRFKQDFPIGKQTLIGLVDLARLSPSGRNAQPLKYALVNEPDLNFKVFSTLGWAAYLKDWKGPVEGDRPAAYIIIVLDKTISQTVSCDHGIAAQSILLGAVELGLGGCMLSTIRREELAAVLHLSEQYEILLVLALGLPVENVMLEALPESGDIKYWRDSEKGHHVPKRALKDIILDI